MNIQEYISSGIVESYVLGLASDEERREFEKSCDQYPEVLAARTAFELSLEKQAMENAIAPPADLKNKIIDTIGASGKVVAMPSGQIRKTSWLKYVAAASVILLAGSLYYNINLYNKNKDLQRDYDNTVAKLNDMDRDMQILWQNPNIKRASLKGMGISPASYATVYWDTTSHDVYLLVNNLPVPASDKQYQLWALLNGKPVDLGVFDIKKEKLLIQAKNTQGAEAFAITLENKGGSPTPTMEKMYVKGEL
ncbi:MAG TPA: anti-sigma factor [Chitinophagaceae bacterium]|nr:anti-sigma factor [Chitinophagaceae bacterium]